VGDTELIREARGGNDDFPVGNYDTERTESRLTRDIALAITDQERAPLSIAPAENKTWEAAAGSKVQVPLNFTRKR